MTTLDPVLLKQKIESELQLYRESRLQKARNLKLRELLERSNPALLKAENINTPIRLIDLLLTTHLWQSAQTAYGKMYENVALYSVIELFNGKVSNLEGIDYEFDRYGKRVLGQHKSSPNWGNDSSIKKLCQNFDRAMSIVHRAFPINFCSFGREPPKTVMGNHLKLCGQSTWSYITNDSDFYTKLLKLINVDRSENGYIKERERVRDKFVQELHEMGVASKSRIDWNAFAQINGAIAEE